jgi:hypothetical protein
MFLERQCIDCTVEHLLRALDAIQTILRDASEYWPEYVLKLRLNLTAAEDHVAVAAGLVTVKEVVRDIKLQANELLVFHGPTQAELALLRKVYEEIAHAVELVETLRREQYAADNETEET